MKLKMLLFILLCSTSLFAQQVTFRAFDVTTSDTISELKKIKLSNPKITVQELAKTGDDLIASKGLNFTFSFSTDLCLKVKDAMDKRKDKSKPITLNAKMNSVDGDIASVALPEILFPATNCGTCFVQMPLAEFSDKEFVSFIQNRLVRFYTPRDIVYENIYLLDPKNHAIMMNSWKTPFRTAPIGISDDGKMIILDLPFDELKEIALLIYDDGTFRFYPKAELDLTAKSETIKENPAPVNLADTTLISFSKGEQKQILRYKNNCP